MPPSINAAKTCLGARPSWGASRSGSAGVAYDRRADCTRPRGSVTSCSSNSWIIPWPWPRSQSSKCSQSGLESALPLMVSLLIDGVPSLLGSKPVSFKGRVHRLLFYTPVEDISLLWSIGKSYCRSEPETERGQYATWISQSSASDTWVPWQPSAWRPPRRWYGHRRGLSEHAAVRVSPFLRAGSGVGRSALSAARAPRQGADYEQYRQQLDVVGDLGGNHVVHSHWLPGRTPARLRPPMPGPSFFPTRASRPAF